MCAVQICCWDTFISFVKEINRKGTDHIYKKTGTEQNQNDHNDMNGAAVHSTKINYTHHRDINRMPIADSHFKF